jgi:hypothetical protein
MGKLVTEFSSSNRPMLNDVEVTYSFKRGEQSQVILAPALDTKRYKLVITDAQLQVPVAVLQPEYAKFLGDKMKAQGHASYFLKRFISKRT